MRHADRAQLKRLVQLGIVDSYRPNPARPSDSVKVTLATGENHLIAYRDLAAYAQGLAQGAWVARKVPTILEQEAAR